MQVDHSSAELIMANGNNLGALEKAVQMNRGTIKGIIYWGAYKAPELEVRLPQPAAPAGL